MSNYKDNLPTVNEQSTNLPNEIVNIAKKLTSGQVKNAKMEWRDDGYLEFTADSSDGQERFSITKCDIGGVIQETTSSIPKPINREQRLERVLELKKQGKTQKEISVYTMTSQKTVSNDVKELKGRGKL